MGATTMRAVVAPDAGGTDALRIIERPRPVPNPGEVLVRVHATAVNRADIMQSRGQYPPPAGVTDILGLEVAGEVADARGSDRWSAGDRIMAVVPGGGYAEWACVPADQLMAVPDGMDLTTAAACPEVFLTAHLALVTLGGLAAGETALVHAGASGVGTAAVQIACEIGATVIATSRSADRLRSANELGARPLVVTDGEFAARVREMTDGAGADVILDLVGAAYWADNVASLARGGRLVLIGMVGGRRTELDLAALYAVNATVIASTLRARPATEKASFVAAFARWGLPRLADGRLRPIIDRVMALEDVAEAHRLVAGDRVVGKVVLTTGL